MHGGRKHDDESERHPRRKEEMRYLEIEGLGNMVRLKVGTLPMREELRLRLVDEDTGIFLDLEWVTIIVRDNRIEVRA